MSVKNPKCDSCHQSMKLIANVNIVKKRYKMRRWYCSLCEIGKATFGMLYNDEEIRPNQSIQDIDELFKQELEARNHE